MAAPLVFLLLFYGLRPQDSLRSRRAAIRRDRPRDGSYPVTGLRRVFGASRWFEKPPLLYWMTRSAFKAGLSDDLAPRLPVALLSAAFLLLFFHQMRREFGEPAALYATGILATSAGWLAYSHVGVTDIPLATTFSAACCLSLPWVRSGGRRGLLLAGSLLGLAVLAKGLVPLVLIAPLLWIAGRRWPDLLILAGAAIAVALPWYVLCYLRNGDSLHGRVHLEAPSGTVPHARPAARPAVVVLHPRFTRIPVSVDAGDRSLPHRTNDNRRKLLLLIVAFGFVFFSAATNKLPGYLLPLLPLIAAIAGLRLTRSRIASPCPHLLGAFARSAACRRYRSGGALAQGLGHTSISRRRLVGRRCRWLPRSVSAIWLAPAESAFNARSQSWS